MLGSNPASPSRAMKSSKYRLVAAPSPRAEITPTVSVSPLGNTQP